MAGSDGLASGGLRFEWNTAVVAAGLMLVTEVVGVEEGAAEPSAELKKATGVEEVETPMAVLRPPPILVTCGCGGPSSLADLGSSAAGAGGCKRARAVSCARLIGFWPPVGGATTAVPTAGCWPGFLLGGFRCGPLLAAEVCCCPVSLVRTAAPSRGGPSRCAGRPAAAAREEPGAGAPLEAVAPGTAVDFPLGEASDTPPGNWLKTARNGIQEGKHTWPGDGGGGGGKGGQGKVLGPS